MELQNTFQNHNWKQNKYVKTSEMLEGFYSEISMNGLSRDNIGKDDTFQCLQGKNWNGLLLQLEF